MDQDISAIESWAQIFTDPAKLSATLAKHYAFHQSEIKTDISTLETDWTAKEYFQAGEDLAALMTVAIGPIESSNSAASTLNDKDAADFVAGFIYGMTGDNYQTAIESCYQGGPIMDQEIETVMTGFKKGSSLGEAGEVIWFHSIEKFGTVLN